MSNRAKLLWLIMSLVALRQVSAAANKTIDALQPDLHYNDIARINGGCCVVAALSGFAGEFGMDSTKLNNGTVVRIERNTIPADLELMQMEMNFTADAPGGGLYLYFAHDGGSGGATDFFLDNLLVGNFSVELDPNNKTPRYNILGYANTSIPTGDHTLGIRVTRGMVYYDHAILNPGDVISSSSAAGAGTGTSTSTASPAPFNPQKKKVAVGAIVGGCIAGIAAVLGFLAGLLLCRRARRRRALNAPAMQQSVPTAPVSQTTPQDTPPVFTDPVVAERVKLLEEQVRRLTERTAEGSSTAGSDTASISVGRSLSTMKREQTRAVHDHEQGTFPTDALVHTDSGLRLMAGRAVEELPPTYVAA